MTRRTTRNTNRRIAFTARTIQALKPEAQSVDWFDQSRPGLALRVQPGGTKSWYFFYKKDGATKRVKLGLWPTLELADARLEADEQRVRVQKEDADPAGEKRKAREAFTMGKLAEEFIEKYAKEHKTRTWKDDQWRINRYVLPVWERRPLSKITRWDVHNVLDQIKADGKPIQANRVQALLSKLWNFAIDRGHAEVNPCHRMQKPGKEVKRERVLNDDEIRALWASLCAAPNDAADSLRLRLLTGQRGGEVHRMRWQDVDLEAAVWTIPKEHAKNGRAHRVPLARLALDVLEARYHGRRDDAEYVFPGLYHQRKDLRAFGAVHGGKYRWHDLRHTVVTRLSGLRVPEEITGRVVNHAKRGVTATVYNQYGYDAEKREALEAWDREVQRIINGRPRAAEVGAVLPFRGRRRRA